MEIKGNKAGMNIQIDSISSATRLLERRKAMYEVQEAFERQKEEFVR